MKKAMKEHKKTVVVVGGGAAGMMAAIAAASSKETPIIYLIEKNGTLGKKLLITGGGRCNVTSAASMEVFREKIPENEKFLYSAFAAFSNQDLMKFLEDRGVHLKREGNKVYPVKDNAHVVLDAFFRELQGRVRLCLNECVKDLLMEDAPEGQQIRGVITDRRKIEADKVIIATGGKSFPSTGSDGSFFSVLADHGVEVTQLYPSLVQILLRSPYGGLQGISVRQVCLKATVSKKRYESRGDILFTQKGISGPASLDMSAYLTKYPVSHIDLHVDFLPTISREEIWERIFETSRKKIENKMADLLPHRLLQELYRDVHLDDLHNKKKEEKERIVDRIKNNRFEVAGFGSIAEGIVTKGGVSLREVKASTLEHKRIQGLFFAGECLDLDALTGGYNLQIAFSTGYLAGKE